MLLHIGDDILLLDCPGDATIHLASRVAKSGMKTLRPPTAIASLKERDAEGHARGKCWGRGVGP